MSAYVLNPEHFGILAAYAAQNDAAIYQCCMDGPIQTAQAVAEMLAWANIKSVMARYPRDLDGQRPGPCLLDAEIIEAAQIYAAHFTVEWAAFPRQRPTPVQILKLLLSFEYQSCEAPDWPHSKAFQQFSWLMGAAIRNLPGYEDADWSYDKALPAIESLYERSKA